jgi:tetraacyldisaccharide 4'-kinase
MSERPIAPTMTAAQEPRRFFDGVTSFCRQVSEGEGPRSMLLPLAWIYGGMGLLRRRAYHAGLLPRQRLPIPVISVGAVAAGGTGKTPVTRWLAASLCSRGARVGVVHGAYRGNERHRVTRLAPSIGWEPGAARRFGDEAILLASWLPEAIVTCGRDKAAAARLAFEQGAELILLDDGLQHQRLRRDVEIVMLGEDGDLLPFPVGDGREFASACRVADLFWHHRRDGRATGLGAAEVESRYRASALLNPEGRLLGAPRDLAGLRVVLLAGVARPEAFARLVEDLGATIVKTLFIGDHRSFRRSHFRMAARLRPDVLLCTEKDAARMRGQRDAGDLVTLSCEVELIKGESIVDRLVAGMRSTCGEPSLSSHP